MDIQNHRKRIIDIPWGEEKPFQPIKFPSGPAYATSEGVFVYGGYSKFAEQDLEIQLSKKVTLKIPKALINIHECLTDTLRILKLSKNWDGEGAEEIDIKTFKNASTFLVEFASYLYNKNLLLIPSPKIFPGSDGSIDLDWNNSGINLLVNIPAYSSNLISLYGENNDTKIEIEFNLEEYSENIFECLVNFILH